MVVEDETLIAMDLEDMLEELGHTVVDVAGSADAAMTQLDHVMDEIDVVLLDANLQVCPPGRETSLRRKTAVHYHLGI